MRHPLVPHLDKLLTYLFAALFFFTPLILWPKTSEVFEFNKLLFVYLLTGIILATFCVRWVLERRIQIVRTPLDLPLLLFLLSQILSTVFSINPHTSIWGYYSRFHGGLASTLTYITLYYLLLTHLHTSATSSIRRSRFYILILALFSSATLISLYAILEHLGIDKDLWVQDVQSRVFSTLGQPNWLSAYLVALLPLPVYLTLNTKNRRNRLVFLIASLFFFLAILYTKSRSGIGTTSIILSLVFAQHLAPRLKRKTKLSRSSRFIILSFLLTLLLVGTPWSPNPIELARRFDLGGPLWSEIEPKLNQVGLTTQIKPLDLGRLPVETQDLINKRAAGKRVGGSDSFEIRQVVWQGALDLFRRRPLLGSGVETFGYAYYWTRPKAHNLLSEWDFIYNKAHNEYLNFLATTGALGLATYLFLIFATLSLFVRLLKRQPNLYLWSFLFGYLSILITNYFGFSVVAVALLFFTFPALALATSDQSLNLLTLGGGVVLTKKQRKQNQMPPLGIRQYLLLAITLGLLFYWLFLLYRQWSADLKYNLARRYLSSGYVAQALPLLHQATTLYPSEPVFLSTLAEAYANAALAIDSQTQSETQTELNPTITPATDTKIAERDFYAAQAIDTAQLALDLNPWHLNFLKSKAKVEISLANFDQSYYEQALHTLLRALELSPTDAKILYNIAVIYQTTNQLPTAITTYQKTLDLKPDYQEARAKLIELLIADNRLDEARQELPLLLEDIPDHPLKDRLTVKP